MAWSSVCILGQVAEGKRSNCNVLDLASLGNAANVCVGSKVYNI
jgi:hypothetical protein